MSGLREAMIQAILDTPMHPVKPSTGELVDSILANPGVVAALAQPAPDDAAALPIGERAVHAHDGLGSHDAERHHRRDDYR